MKLIRDIRHLQLKNTIVTLGKFDGNHIGHQLLFRTAIRLKQELAAMDQTDPAAYQAVIFTFDVHPDRLLEQQEIRTIQTSKEREMRQYPEGIDAVIYFPFNRETMSMEPEAFVKQILVDQLGVRAIVAGEDFRFGKERRGDIALLQKLADVYGFEVRAVRKLTIRMEDGEAVREISSSLIKEEIRKGHMEQVARMLGEPFSVTGTIQSGKHLGNTIGFPTINMNVPPDKILPPDGVYATRTRIGNQTYDGMTNIGHRPTFDDGEQRNIETNLFDFDSDVYGETAVVSFYCYIRPEKRFDSVEELVKELAANKHEIQEYFQSLEER